MRWAALAVALCLLGSGGCAFASEERLIGWKGEVPRSAGDKLRGGGVAKGVPKKVRGSLGTDGQPWMEALAWAPRAFLYHNFLSKEECEHIMMLAKPRLRRSQARKLPVWSAKNCFFACFFACSTGK